MEYLKIAQDLEMYGVNYFAIKVSLGQGGVSLVSHVSHVKGWFFHYRLTFKLTLRLLAGIFVRCASYFSVARRASGRLITEFSQENEQVTTTIHSTCLGLGKLKSL